VFERADGGDLGSFQPLRARELCQRGDRLIARVAHHDVGDHIRVLDDLGLHRRLLTIRYLPV
jgi:hypothetical protein